ncbi:hypothetical protein [Kitasatospora sp. NPDC059599]|uniref:hypothetical protein n=1 Tax=Kitasatospora sp. NPDC059599 TaxID=3346880 RepID=UPI0036C3CBF8
MLAAMGGFDLGRPAAPRPGSRKTDPAHRPHRPFGRLAAVLGLVALGCISCAGAGGETAAIRQAELVGDWSNAAGARLHVSADHSLTASGIREAVPDYTCPSTLAAGRWQFWRQDGSSDNADASPAEGASFDVWASSKGATGGCDIVAQVQRDDRGFDICLVLDPDQSCTSEELLRKDSSQPR